MLAGLISGYELRVDRYVNVIIIWCQAGDAIFLSYYVGMQGVKVTRVALKVSVANSIQGLVQVSDKG